ncbi:cutinase family protein [Actinomycetospora chibensis]|uniref:Cutinase family protein n=1 Tax=Actinomycetospora chibensis TaxID=663606 RepID=A0ABV9RGR2_9PSEU|nr:cutinase family protein [Actinomycetospora chibensis]MDD7923600.1 cutinase family protein [Actinomycetospora chibensis]
MRSVRGGGELVDRFGRAVPAAPVVRLRVDPTPGGVPLLVDDVAVPVRRGADPHRAGLAAAARRAAHLGRPVRVEMAARWSAWPLVVHPDGAVDDARAPRAAPVVGTRGAWDDVAPRSRRRAPVLGGVADRPRRRPVGVLAVAGALAATLLVGALGTGVVTLAAPDAAPAECRDVTLFAVNGSGAAGGETLAAVTDPLVQQVGERLAVVAVAGPEVGASYEASEQQAVTTLTDQVAAQLAACPGSRAMLFGYSQGAHVAGDVAARVGAGQDPRVPADRVLAVGLFGDPARSAGVRTVPAGVTGQGVLPAREGGFGALAARTIEVCAPQDPVCATAAGATPPSLEQAVAAPAHIDYPQLTVAPDAPATRWASESLVRLITSLPAPGTTPAGGQPAGTATGAPSAGTTAPGTTAPGTTAPGTTAPGTTAPGTTASGTTAPGTGTDPSYDTGAGAAEPTGTSAPGTSAGGGAPRAADPGADTGYDTGGGTGSGSGGATATTAPNTGSGSGGAPDSGGAGSGSAPTGSRAPTATTLPRTGGTGSGTGTGSGSGSADSSSTPRSTTPPDEPPTTGRGRGTGTDSTGTSTGSAPGSDASSSGGEDGGGDASDSEASGADVSGSGGVGAEPTTTRTTPSDAGGDPDRSGDGALGDDAADEAGSSGQAGDSRTGSAGEATDALWSLTSGLAGFQDSNGGNVEGGGLDPEEAESPNVPGRQVVKLEVPGGAKRSEVRPEEAQDIRAGEHLFFGYSAFLPADFPVDTSDWQVIWQLHDGGTNTSPPVALEIVDGNLWLANVGDRVRDLGPVQAGRNLDVQLDIEFEEGGGSVSVYRGGRQVLQDFRPPRGTMIDSFDYLKTGIYRHTGGPAEPATIFLNDLKIGETLESVSGLAGAEAGGGSGQGGAQTGDADGGTDASNTGAGTGTSTRTGAGPASTGAGSTGSAGAGTSATRGAARPSELPRSPG